MAIINGRGRVGIRRTSAAPSIVTSGLKLHLDAGNVASYPGTGTVWTDLSGNNNNITLNGPTGGFPSYSSANGGSIVFDGTDDYGFGTYNSTLNLSTNNFTLECWFNSTSFSTTQVLLSKDTYGVNFDWCIQIANSTTIRLYSNKTLGPNVAATVPTMSVNMWHHVVISSIAGSIRIYLNGVLYTTQSLTISNDSQNFFTIGAASYNNRNSFVKGKISIVRIYSKGLTDSEVSQNYNALKSRYTPEPIVASGLKLHLDAGNVASYTGTGTVWADLSGNGNNGTLINGGSGLSFNSANGGYLQFDGLNDYVSTNYIPNSNGFTYCIWGKSSFGGYPNRIMGNADSIAGLSGANIMWGVPDINKIWYVRRDGSSYDIISGTIGNFTGNWHYLVATYDSVAGSVLYCDGIVVGQKSNTGFSSTLTLRIGKDGNGSDAFKGNISNVQVYNRALSAAEVLQNYNALRGRFGL